MTILLYNHDLSYRYRSEAFTKYIGQGVGAELGGIFGMEPVLKVGDS